MYFQFTKAYLFPGTVKLVLAICPSSDKNDCKKFWDIFFYQALVFTLVWSTDRETSEALREVKIAQTLNGSRIFLLLWSCFQLYVILPDFLILTLACNLQSEMTTSVSFALYWSELVTTIANKMWATIYKRGYK